MGNNWELLNGIVSDLKDNWRDKFWWRERIRDRINTPVQSTLRPRENAMNFVDQDWDTLIILDACRNDLFNEVINESKFDEINTVRSPGSFTREWVSKTFDDEHGDIVYATGNPMVSDQKPDGFHSLIEAWRDGWDPEAKIVRPEAVTEAALQARRDHPNKRLIVHYMQPHAPFIDRPNLNFWADPDALEREVSEDRPESDTRIDDVWDALAAGIVEQDEVWRAYRHTLEVVMREVDRLLEQFDDQIVVTSDHGNLLGERGWQYRYECSGIRRVKE